MRVNAVVVAAGEGKRMGATVPKAYLPIGNRPMILHTLSRFAVSQVRKVIVVAGRDELSACQELIESDSRLQGLEFVVEAGGPRRQDSVSRGLARVDPDCEIIVIHDGARPFVPAYLIDQCIEIALVEGAVVVGVPARNTIKVVSPDNRVVATLPRASLWEIQTPQVFQINLIREAYKAAEQENIEATDDAMLVERLGKSVRVLEGHPTNIKITVPEDILFAEALLREGRVVG
ncbi:MAG: 2-C-methyl-D-erythritol 4-phosphate cytidylyltransferase [Deltaproteobacteria bacterium]|nr:2-C-methyl-D-erythritol 4-phosphate cytidylyltransferase [Deltaproteobacteria bacterium]